MIKAKQKQWTKRQILRLVKAVRSSVVPDAYWERGYQAACDEIIRRIKEKK